MNGSGSGSCQIGIFGISGVEISTTRKLLVNYMLKT